MPELAPGALEPDDPMLFRTPCRATGLSDANQDVSDPVALASSGDGAGAARAVAANGRRYLSNMAKTADLMDTR
jgi:hypothetical protein